MRKLDFAPLLDLIAREHDLAPADIFKAANAVAPGQVSRRALGYWMSDSQKAGARRCSASHIALILMGLDCKGLVSRSDFQRYRMLMRQMAELVSGAEGPREVDPMVLSLVDRSSSRAEHQAARAHPERHRGAKLGFDASQASSSVPGA